MRAKLIHEERGEKTFALVFDKGDEAVGGLTEFAKENNLDAASFTAVGAFSDARLGFFEWERKEYKEIPIDEQVEVLSLVGDIALKEVGEPQVHPHVVVGKADGTAHGGHLLEAHVRPTLEVILVESPEHLHKKTDQETGLALIDIEEG